MQQVDNSIPVQLTAASKRYGSVVALDKVDLTVRRGELIAVLGPNGAGKTTAIALCLGLSSVDSGSVRLFGDSPHALAARRKVGVMLQSTNMPDTLKVRELLAQTRSYYPDPRSTEECVQLAGLDGLMDRRYAKLSGGQQRRVQFAMAICGRPELLFLDEPTVGLDIESRTSLWRTMREMVAEGCAVVLTTHYLEEAEALADRIVVLTNGHVVASGSVSEIRARVTQRRIRCVSELDTSIVSRWPEVSSVARNGERIEIVTDAAEVVVRQLLFEDSNLRELEVQRAGLADAFVEITRNEQQREAA